jgi:hypothetical protein
MGLRERPGDGARTVSRWDPTWENGRPKARATIHFTASAYIGHYPGPGIEYDDPCHAAVVLHRLCMLYGRRGEKAFYVDASASESRNDDGDKDDRVQFQGTYTAKGANSHDVRKKIEAAAKFHGRFVIGKPEVTITSTTY